VVGTALAILARFADAMVDRAAPVVCWPRLEGCFVNEPDCEEAIEIFELY
jgi:hypothetical protein